MGQILFFANIVFWQIVKMPVRFFNMIREKFVDWLMS